MTRMMIRTSECDDFWRVTLASSWALASIRVTVMRLTGSSDSDDEDETAALMAELAKIKQERAEEKARQVSTLLRSFRPRATCRSYLTPCALCPQGTT
jgi:hypothetical protein